MFLRTSDTASAYAKSLPSYVSTITVLEKFSGILIVASCNGMKTNVPFLENLFVSDTNPVHSLQTPS